MGILTAMDEATTFPERAEQRRLTALQLAVTLLAGQTGLAEKVIAQAKQFEDYLRSDR